jgi:cytochrome b subunit of formate dehydrogenase
MTTSKLLLPNVFRPIGILFLLLGLILLVLRYQFKFEPDFLNLKVFAVYTYYIQSKSFTFITNQMTEEIGGILVVTGLFFMAFSKEKIEVEFMDSIRLKALIVSAYANLMYLLLALLLFFGFGFVGALTVFIGEWLVSYLISYRYFVHRYHKENRS